MRAAPKGPPDPPGSPATAPVAAPAGPLPVDPDDEVSVPRATTPAELERLIAEAEADVKRREADVLAAPDGATADAARDALTDAELRLEALLDRRPEGASCEGWPRGK